MLITSRGVDEKTPCCSWLEIPRQMHCTVWGVILCPSALSPLVCCLLALSACHFCISPFSDFLTSCIVFWSFLFPQRELKQNWSWIHERTISLSVLGIILRVLRIRIQCLHYKPVSNHFCSYTSTVVGILKNYCAKNLGSPEVELRLSIWIIFFKFLTGWTDLSSSLRPYYICVYCNCKYTVEGRGLRSGDLRLNTRTQND